MQQRVSEFILIFFLGLTCSAGQVYAKEDAYDRPEICPGYPYVIGELGCLEKKAQESDVALKAAEARLTEAIAKWPNQDEVTIKLAQKKHYVSALAFEAYRTTQCEFGGSIAGVSATVAVSMSRATCLLEISAERMKRLESIIGEFNGKPIKHRQIPTIESVKKSGTDLRKTADKALASLSNWHQPLWFILRTKEYLEWANRGFFFYRKTQCGLETHITVSADKNVQEKRRLTCLYELNRQHSIRLSYATDLRPVPLELRYAVANDMRYYLQDIEEKKGRTRWEYNDSDDRSLSYSAWRESENTVTASGLELKPFDSSIHIIRFGRDRYILFPIAVNHLYCTTRKPSCTMEIRFDGGPLETFKARYDESIHIFAGVGQLIVDGLERDRLYARIKKSKWMTVRFLFADKKYYAFDFKLTGLYIDDWW